MNMIRAGIVLLAALSAPAFASETEPLVGDRPDFTESATTVASRRVQLEAGATAVHAESADALTLGEVLLRIGLIDRLELRVGINSYATIDVPGDDLSGMEDSSLGIKYRLDDPASDDGHDWAILVDTTLTTGSDDIGAEDAQPGVRLAWGSALNDRLDLSANAGYSRASDGDERFDQFSASAALGIGVGERVGIFVELFGFSEEEEDGPGSTYGDAGVTWLVSEDLQFDARIGLGLGGTDVDAFYGLGVIKRW